jgi:hypothetical protein
MNKLKLVVKSLTEILAPLTPIERKDIINNLLTLVVSAEYKDAKKRPNRQGNPLECPFGIFRSRADCTRYIESHHCAEFLKKYPGFKTTAYTERVAQIKDNSPERHYIYWAIYTMCVSSNYPEWNFLEVKDKID